MKSGKRFLALLLAFLLAFGNLSTVAFAAEGGEPETQQTEQLPAEAPAPDTAEPPADAEAQTAPQEPVSEQAPAEPAPEQAQTAEPAPEQAPEQVPETEQAPAADPSAQVPAPEEQPADANVDNYAPADPGVNGFQLPGVEVDPNAAETEIVAPEPQADPNTNAENGIATIAGSQCYTTHFSIYVAGNGNVNPNEPALNDSSGYRGDWTYSAGSHPYNPEMLRSKGNSGFWKNGVGWYWFNNSGDGVAAALNVQPTDEQIKSVIPSYDPDAQYVVWYIIKEQGYDGLAGEYYETHVDGVIRNRDVVYLDYNRNGAPADTATQYPKTQTVVKGETVTVWESAPTWKDHTFLGWATSSNGQVVYSPGGEIVMNESVTLYAVWQELQPEISITKAATDPEKVYSEGETVSYRVTVSNAPGKGTAYNLAVTDSMVGKTGFANTTNQSGVTFRPGSGWTIAELTPGKSVTITYTYMVQAEDLGRNGAQGTLPNTARAEGKTVEASVQTAARPQVTVTVRYQDEDGNAIKVDDTQSVDKDGSYDVSDKKNTSIDGYVFDHWNGGPTGTASDDVTVTAVYAKDTNHNGEADKNEEHHVTYMWGGEVPEGAELPVDNTVYHPGDTYEITDKYSKGDIIVTEKDEHGNPMEEYVFQGWEPAVGGAIDDSDVTVTGSWEKKTHSADEYKHTVTYKYKDSAPESAEVPKSATYTKGQKYSLPSVELVEKTDTFGNVVGTWTFNGWFKDGVKAEDTQTMGTDNVTYTGTWTYTPAEKDTYTGKVTVEYTYDGEEGDAPEGAETELKGVYGSTVTVDPAETVEIDGVNYMLDPGHGAFNAEVTRKGSTITVPYVKDADNDGEPDYRETNEITVTVKNGTADPAESPITVKYGEDQTITFKANDGYALDSVTVDNEPAELSVLADGSYTFKNVTKKHDIKVVYAKDANDDGKPDKDQELLVEVVGETFEATYDGQPHTAGYTVKVTLNGKVTEYENGVDLPEWLGLTIDKSVRSHTEVNVCDIPLGINEDTVTLTKAFASTLNLEDGRLHITPAKLTITVDGASKTYGADDPEFTAEVEGWQGSDEGTVGLRMTIFRTNADEEDVGEYEGVITAEVGAELNNYEVEINPGTFTIKMAAAEDYTTELKINNWTYGEDPSEPEAYVTAGPGYEEYGYPTFTYYDEDGNELKERPTDAGEYWVKATWEGNENLPELSKTAIFTIDKATLTVTADNKTKVYGEKDPAFTYAVDGLKDGDDKSLVSDVTFSRVDGESVGTYTITPSGVPEIDNYIIEYKTGTLTITAKEYDPDDPANSITVEPLDNVTYNGGTQEQEPVVKDGEKTLQKDVDYTLSYAGDTTNVTEKGVTVTVKFKGNYSGSAEVAYKINPITLQFNQVQHQTYTGDPITMKLATNAEGFRFTQGGLADGDTLTFDDSITGTDAGTYWSKNSLNGLYLNVENIVDIKDDNDKDASGNYTISGSAKLIIDPQPVTVTITGESDSVMYDGNKHEVNGYSYKVPEGVTVAMKVGDTAHAEGTVPGTYWMELTKDRFTVDGGKNYTIEEVVVVDGKLTITDRPENEKFEITLQPKGGEFTYNGTEQSVSGFEGLTFEVGGNTYTVEGLTASISGTDAGTYDVTVTGEPVVKDAAGNDVTSQFKVNISKAQLVIGKQPVTINWSATSPYTGAAVTFNFDTERVTRTEGLVDGHKLASLTGAIGAEGAYEGNWTAFEAQIMSGTEDVTKNYDITLNVSIKFTPGALSIDPRDVTYDGKAHATLSNAELHPWTESGAYIDLNEKMSDGSARYQVTYKRGGEETGDNVNAGDVTVILHDNKELYADATATFNIAKRPLHLQSGSGSWVYNGQVHHVYEYTISGAAEGDVIQAKNDSFAGIVDVGTVDNTFYIDWNSALESNYEVQLAEWGKLTIEPKAFDPDHPEDSDISVTAPGNVTYNGKAQEQKPEVKDGDKVLVEGKDYDLRYENNTNAGIASVTVEFKGNYSGTASTSFTINKAPLTVTANNSSKTFGDADPAFTYAVGGLQGSDSSSLVTGVTFSRVAGESVGAYTITPAGAAEIDNYTITYQTGTLTISARNIDPADPAASGITVTAPGNVTYNGASQQQAPVVTDNGSILVPGTDYTLSYSPDTTNVGTVTVTVTFTGNYSGSAQTTYQITPAAVTVTAANAAKVYGGADPALTATVTGLVRGDAASVIRYTVARAAGENVGTYAITPAGGAAQGNYTVTYVPGTFTITPAAVTVTANNAAKVYGTNDPANFTANVTGLMRGDAANTIRYTVARAAGENVGAYAITPTGGAAQGNYTVTYVPGTFTITSQTVAGMTVTEPADVVYDGAAHQWAPTVTDANGRVLTAGTDYTVTFNTADFTDVGTIEATVTGIGNYTGTISRTYQITRRPVTLASADAAKVYDGAALTEDGITVGGEGFAAGEGARYTVTGTRTAVGTSRNTFNYTLRANTKASNYRITRNYGTLTVTPAALAANAPANFLYNGAAHQWAPTVTGANGAVLQQGVDYNVAYSTANFTDVGAITVTITGAGNYAGSTLNRTYNITPRTVTLTSATATKAYDGTVLRAQNVTVGGQGFAAGEGATYNVTGRRTVVGTSLNTFTYTLNANTDAGNYTINQTFGRLVITQAENPADEDEGPDNGPDEGPAGPGNGPDNGPAAPDNGPDDAGLTDIPDDDVPLGDTPEDEAPLADTPEDDGNVIDIPDDDVPLGDTPKDEPQPDYDYSLGEEEIIDEDDVPLGAGPSEEACCILHFILMLCALAVTVYYTVDRKRHQQREFELRSELK